MPGHYGTTDLELLFQKRFEARHDSRHDTFQKNWPKLDRGAIEIDHLSVCINLGTLYKNKESSNSRTWAGTRVVS